MLHVVCRPSRGARTEAGEETRQARVASLSAAISIANRRLWSHPTPPGAVGHSFADPGLRCCRKHLRTSRPKGDAVTTALRSRPAHSPSTGRTSAASSGPPHRCLPHAPRARRPLRGAARSPSPRPEANVVAAESRRPGSHGHQHHPQDASPHLREDLRDDQRLAGMTFTPHDFRTLFATDFVNGGLPTHPTPAPPCPDN